MLIFLANCLVLLSSTDCSWRSLNVMQFCLEGLMHGILFKELRACMKPYDSLCTSNDCQWGAHQQTSHLHEYPKVDCYCTVYHWSHYHLTKWTFLPLTMKRCLLQELCVVNHSLNIHIGGKKVNRVVHLNNENVSPLLRDVCFWCW